MTYIWVFLRDLIVSVLLNLKKYSQHGQIEATPEKRQPDCLHYWNDINFNTRFTNDVYLIFAWHYNLTTTCPLGGNALKKDLASLPGINKVISGNISGLRSLITSLLVDRRVFI
jgi:hypothetical protein